MDRSEVGIIIPALNEARSIAAVISRSVQFGTPIVIDDGSTDETASIAAAAGAIVVSHPENLGYDPALNSGFKHGASLGFKVLVTLDADGQHDPRLLGLLLEQIDKGADLALGVRNRKARMAERLFASYTKSRYGIHDPLCGLKAYRVEAYRSLGHFDANGSIGTELTLHAARHGYRIAEVPFQVGDREDQPRFGRAFGANLRILRALLLAMRANKSR